MTTEQETRTLYVAYTNTDRTEGKGIDVPIAVCEIEATAIRHARHAYVQGGDGPVREATAVKLDGVWHLPQRLLKILPPSEEDLAVQAALDAKRAAIQRALALGLTADDIKAIGVGDG